MKGGAAINTDAFLGERARGPRQAEIGFEISSGRPAGGRDWPPRPCSVFQLPAAPLMNRFSSVFSPMAFPSQCYCVGQLASSTGF